MKHALISLTISESIRHTLHAYYRGIFDKISTLQNGKEYRLRKTVKRIRYIFESCKIDVIRWIRTAKNIADGLAKRYPDINREINNFSAPGTLTIYETNIRELVSEECK